MDELKEWLNEVIDSCEKQEKTIEVTGVYTRFEKEKLITERLAYQAVLDKIKRVEILEKLEPVFCTACGKQMINDMFCSQECSEYETLE